MTLRQHDVVLADGRFRIVLTDRRRLFAVLDAPETALGPLRVALEIDRRPPRQLPSLDDPTREHVVSGLAAGGPDVADAASGRAFDAASSRAALLAPSVLLALRETAAREARHLGESASLLPVRSRRPIESAARIVLRARLGDVTAKRFVERVVRSARASDPSARPIVQTLLAGARFVDRALSRSASVGEPFWRLAAILQRGDLAEPTAIATDGRPREERAEARSSEDVELEELTSPRFVQPLSRAFESSNTVVGFGVGDAIGIAGDAASGNVAGAIGDAGGAAGGSIAKGAAIGGAIGSVIPGIGTAIGGAVGAVIGGLGSLFGHHHSGPIDFEHLFGGVGHKMARKIADKIRSAPRWQAHFQAVYRHLPAGTANVKGLGDLVAHELFPHDEFGKDATTGHADGLAEWFAEQPDWEALLHSQGVPPGDRHQLEARIHAATKRRETARNAWDVLLHRSRPTAASPPRPPPPIRPDMLPSWEPVAALPMTTGCDCDPPARGDS